MIVKVEKGSGYKFFDVIDFEWDYVGHNEIPDETVELLDSESKISRAEVLLSMTLSTGKKANAIANGQVFLLNDNGKTIDKIGL